MRKLGLFLVFALGILLIFFSFNGATQKELDKSMLKRPVSSMEKVQVVQLDKITGPKDYCEVIHTGPPFWCINNWIQGYREYYGSYQDPLEAGCIDPYPFQISNINFLLCASKTCTTEIYVDIMDANLDDPTCPFPSRTIFASDFYTMVIPAPGEYHIYVPIEEKVCVDGPYFAGFCFPDSVEGLGPITDDSPDGCQSYVWLDSIPVDLVGPPMEFPGNIILYSSGYTSAQNNCNEYSPPLPVIIQPNDTAWYCHTYFSDSVEISVYDTSYDSKIAYATFEYMDSAGDWHLIATDYDGTDIWYSTWDTTGMIGDGWSCFWVANGLEEGYYQIRATMTDSLDRSASDMVTIYYDPLPPVPIIIQPGSTGTFCSPIEVLFTLDADHIAEIEARIYKLTEGWWDNGGTIQSISTNGDSSTYDKGIPPMKQEDLYKWGKDDTGKPTNAGCAPTAAAACLKWWGSHGFPGITGGLSDKDLVNELAGPGYMKTSPSKGTKDKGTVNGLNRWIREKLGECVFKLVDEKRPLGRWNWLFKLYARELKKEDILVAWISKNGKHRHLTTGNSVTPDKGQYDVMNPATGAIETYPWGWGAGSGDDQYYIRKLFILSPKVQPEPPPGTPGPTAEQKTDTDYRMVWDADTAETPYNQWYSFHVKVTDSLGHVGEDLFFFELVDYVCGDANGDGETTISDAVYLINYIFKSGPAPDPVDAGNLNCENDVDVTDVVYLINYLFRSGPMPPPCE